MNLQENLQKIHNEDETYELYNKDSIQFIEEFIEYNTENHHQTLFHTIE